MVIQREFQYTKKSAIPVHHKKAEMLNWIHQLELIPHPEGGYYKQTYRSSEAISDRELKNIQFQGERLLSTSIYFLLPSNEVSRFHRLISDELWYYHYGSSLTIHLILPDGEYKELRLGPQFQKGERLQAVIPRGTIFGSTVNEPHSYSLVGCMVSPGFDFRDFELFDKHELIKLYPHYKELIVKLAP